MKETQKEQLTLFKKAVDGMVATNTAATSYWGNRRATMRIENYSAEEVEKILSSGSLSQQQALSNNYFEKDGFYKRILIHYATLLKYVGVLIPYPTVGKTIKDKTIESKYQLALDLIETMKLPAFFTNCSLKALVNGVYFGLILKADKKNFVTLDLPIEYCCTRFKNAQGLDLIEFNLGYFDSFSNDGLKKEALKCYPSYIRKAYNAYSKGRGDQWVFLPAEFSICFPMLNNGIPPLLNIIRASINYEDSVELEKKRDIEEIKKILVQKIPHNNQNELLFEPDEAEVMHTGATNMLKGNENLSVLTTYADVDCISSKTTNDAVSNNLEKMVNNIYYDAGVSGLLFGGNSNSALDPSVKNDIGFMTLLTNKYEVFVENLINRIVSSNAVRFKYSILPVTRFNDDKYADLTFKLASSGYSYILPALACGISQKDLVCLKDLENNLLKLGEKLIPLQSAFTQSGENEGAGAPKKEEEEKKPQTKENEKSLDKQGVIGNENN